MKIYAITRGNYSDYHICALTVDRERAERLKKLHSDDYGEAEIEEFEDSESRDIRVLWEYDAKCDTVEHADPYHGNSEGIMWDTIGSRGCIVYVLAEDAAHARKKAQDMIAEYKAKWEGVK